jgi:multiple sugar transport system permease protein
MVQTLPVSLYMLGNYFRTIPFSIEEAAMIDGCSRFETIWRIIVPLSLPALATVFIYAFMIAWNEYLFASVFLKSYKNLYTLSIGLKSLFVSKNAIYHGSLHADRHTRSGSVHAHSKESGRWIDRRRCQRVRIS